MVRRKLLRAGLYTGLAALTAMGTERVEEQSGEAAPEGNGAVGAEKLADDDALLRNLKPGAAAHAGQKPDEPTAPSGPQLGPRPRRRRSGPNPLLVLGVAFAAGIVLAKVVDWRGHAHPRT
jgi:hypothetical protein